jgi:hypothetical protein
MVRRKDNRKVGKYVKKQAQSWLDIVDGKSEEAYVDEKAYKKCVKSKIDGSSGFAMLYV